MITPIVKANILIRVIIRVLTNSHNFIIFIVKIKIIIFIVMYL